MSSNNNNDNYGYGEEPEKPDRAELAARTKKRMELGQSGSWRDNTTRAWSPDDFFKAVQRSKAIKNPEITGLIVGQANNETERQIIEEHNKKVTADYYAKKRRLH